MQIKFESNEAGQCFTPCEVFEKKMVGSHACQSCEHLKAIATNRGFVECNQNIQ